MNFTDLFHEMTPAERKRFEASVEATKKKILDAFVGRRTMEDILRDQHSRPRLKPEKSRLRAKLSQDGGGDE